MKEIKEYILQKFLPGAKEEELSTDLDLIGLKILDSLNVLKLVIFLESRYDFSIEPHELDFDNFKSLAAIHKFVLEKKGEKE